MIGWTSAADSIHVEESPDTCSGGAPSSRDKPEITLDVREGAEWLCSIQPGSV